MQANGKNRSLWVEAWPEKNWGLDLGVSIDLGSNLNAFQAYRTITESRYVTADGRSIWTGLKTQEGLTYNWNREDNEFPWQPE